jgi:hypothetical protein
VNDTELTEEQGILGEVLAPVYIHKELTTAILSVVDIKCPVVMQLERLTLGMMWVLIRFRISNP